MHCGASLCASAPGMRRLPRPCAPSRMPPAYDQNAGPRRSRAALFQRKSAGKNARLPRQKRLRGILIGGMLCIAALAAGAVFSMKVLFKLSSIEVRQPEEEPTVYSEEQITAALGLEMGTQLFSVDLKQAEKKLKHVAAPICARCR